MRLRGDDRILVVSDIDNTLILENAAMQPGLAALRAWLRRRPCNVVFVVATGRSSVSARRLLRAHAMPSPDWLITSVGTEICSGSGNARIESWSARLNASWQRDALEAMVSEWPGLMLQPVSNQAPFKLSCFIESARFDARAFAAAIRERAPWAHAVVSRNRFVDLLPSKASKGQAVRYLAAYLGIHPDRTVACGDSGNDRDMLETCGYGIVVRNAHDDLNDLRRSPTIYFSKAPAARGVLEGLSHYGVLDRICAEHRVTHGRRKLLRAVARCRSLRAS